jgi:polyisoprenoid-binding protein YceI
MKLLLLSLFTFSALFSLETEVFWTAFKTHKKIGVSGTFDTVKTVGERLENLSVKIETASINSGHAGRDFTLVNAFWKIQKIDQILAKVVEVKKEKISVEIEMNGIKKVIEMKKSEEGDEVVAEGVIELSDFDMMKSLHSVNSYCYILHDGKTWTDVSVSFRVSKF